MRGALIFAALFIPTFASGEAVFDRINAPDHVYTGGWEHFVGGGVAVFDCDGDDLPELYVAGGTAPAALMHNRSSDGTLTFENRTPEALALTGVTGAYPLDIDGDGHTDLAVLRVGENLLLKGGPDCAFGRFSLGFTSPESWTTAFSATWEKGASLPTMAFGNYVDRADPEGPFEACDDNTLYRPDGTAYGAPLPLAPGFCALSILFSDWGRRGEPDLRMSNDRHYFVRDGGEQLWSLAGEPRLYTEADGWKPIAIWGMGIASRDVNGDGLPEIFLTSMGDQKLHRLDGDAARPSYVDAPFSTGITAHRPYVGNDGRPSTGWHAAFGDVNNDGRDDLFIAKGNVDAMPGNAMLDPNNLLIQQTDGTFAEYGDRAGIASTAKARGGALTDLDLDGRLDLVVVNRDAPLEIYRNVTPVDGAGAWALLRLRQPGPNVDAVGAWIEVRTDDRVYAREVTVGGGHAGGVMSFHHFGLGRIDKAEVRVIWPDGAISDWLALPLMVRRLIRRAGTDGSIEIR